MKNKNIYLILIVLSILLLYISGAALAGNITGTVKVRGLRSPGNILVYLTKAPATPLNLAKTTFVMDQQNLTFLPHVLPIPAGSTVLFPNNDKVDHNVFSLSRSNPFNLGNYKPGEHRTVKFDNPGIVELRCDLHAEMVAYILVMKHPYFAVTDASGRFAIPSTGYFKKYGIPPIESLPAGKYTVKTWHEKLKSGRKKVTVPETGETGVALSLTRGTPSVLYKR